jgi:outer membrane protein assembly factor BamB
MTLRRIAVAVAVITSALSLAAPAASGAAGPAQAAAIRLAVPAIANTYPLPTSHNNALLALPDQLWVGTFGARAGIDVRSPADGSLIGSVPLAVGASKLVRWLVYDGHRVWALVSDALIQTNQKVQLVAIDPVTRKIVITVKLPALMATGLAYTDGKIFLGTLCIWYAIDPATGKVVAQATPLCLASYRDFVTAGGFVWAATAASSEVENASTLRWVKDLSSRIDRMAVVGTKVWATGLYGAPGAQATLFALDTHNPTATPAPRIRLDLEYHLKGGLAAVRTQNFLIYDGTSLWLAAGVADRFVSQHNAQTGHVIRRIAIVSAAEFAAATNAPMSMSFDGHSLWVLTRKSLVRIALS